MSGAGGRRSGPSARWTPTATYAVSVNGELHTVDIGADGIQIDGMPVSAELTEVSGSPIRMLRVQDAVYELLAWSAGDRGTYTITIAGARVRVEALDERARAARAVVSAAASHLGIQPLRAPMPGLIVRVLAVPGDAVNAGDALVVIEAMKMENELRARTAGKVRAVHIAPGTAVEKGAVLVEFD